MLELDWMVMLVSLPVPRSFAATCTMPLASMLNVTSICGIPLGAGAMPSSLKSPRVLLSFAKSLSPCRTWISTEVCPSAAVENIWLFWVGMVVFLSMIFVLMPPSVSIPSDRGVTSSSTMSLISLLRTPPWMAAPMATHSSGLMPLKASLPMIFFTASWTAGILVEPPTRRTLSRSPGCSPASLRA